MLAKDSESEPVTEAVQVLDLRNVVKVFKSGRRTVEALCGVSFQVRPGVITGLIGPDGAGKTTIMRLAAGLLIPDSGVITFFGVNVTHRPTEVQSALGYMPQHFGLYEDLTVQENLDLYADLRGVAHMERSARYSQLLHMTGLGPFTSRLAGRLSGGMKQKLGLACTLVKSPRLLLLDEPTVGVDPVSRRELWTIVGGLVAGEGMSVLLSTAYLDEAERCNWVVLLHEGQILGEGEPAKFKAPMQGRTFRVSAPGFPKRTSQKRLMENETVVDAVIQGEGVRVVLKPGVKPDARWMLPDGANGSVDEVEPRFEDAFVALLHDRSAESPQNTLVEMEEQQLDQNISTQIGTVIEVKDVTRRFGDFYAVRGITFDVGRGEIFGLLGANGAGKSTTFRMLCGLLPASGGSLRVAGLDLRHAAATARGRIGYMSQKFSLYGVLSVAENLQFFSSAYGLGGKRRSLRIDWALRQFGLEPVFSSTSSDLPLGYKQRLALACALMHEPDILFLDEPTSGVDPLARREFWRRISALAEQGVTVLVTTHFMEEAEYCDRLAIMADGEILALGTPEQIKDRMRTDVRPEPTMEDSFIGLLEDHEAMKAESV